MRKARIRGRIIRILDNRTVIINLGRADHITPGSIFNILGEPEVVIDPFAEEELGSVSVVKGKITALQIYDRFTIAEAKRVASLTAIDFFTRDVAIMGAEVDEGKLLVKQEDIQPWKAQSETPVQVGDYVEVGVDIPEVETDKLPEKSGEGEETPGARKKDDLTEQAEQAELGS